MKNERIVDVAVTVAPVMQWLSDHGIGYGSMLLTTEKFFRETWPDIKPTGSGIYETTYRGVHFWAVVHESEAANA